MKTLSVTRKMTRKMTKTCLHASIQPKTSSDVVEISVARKVTKACLDAFIQPDLIQGRENIRGEESDESMSACLHSARPHPMT
jgi:hypothetical protein